MEIWKNKKIGKVALNGNSAMIDTEGIKKRWWNLSNCYLDF